MTEWSMNDLSFSLKVLNNNSYNFTITSLDISVDNSLVVSGSSDSTIIVRNRTNNKTIAHL